MATDSDCYCVIENLFTKSFHSRPYDEKENIIKSERPKPKLNITTTTKKFVRHFHDKIYEDIEWLCGCIKMQKLFCWPCLLFSMEISVWNKNGFDDLNNLSKARKRHENSKCHIDSSVKLKQFANENRIELNISENIENYNKKVTANRYILSKFIDVIYFWSKQAMTFEGYEECDNNRGNYIELMNLLTTSDNQLKMHLEKSTILIDSSNGIPNNLVKSLENILLQEIQKEVENATFVAIIVDATTDGAHTSTVFRYMKDNGNIEERFVGFTHVRDANLLCTHIESNLDEFQCTKKLVAQSYNSDQHSVQARIKEISEHAIFVHCYAHRFNDIFAHSLGFIKECKIFFQTVTGFSLFFSKFREEITNCLPSATGIKWDCNSRIVDYLMEYKNELKLFLWKMVENPEKWDCDAIITARGLYHFLTDFHFQFLLLVFHQIFAQSDVLFDSLQKNNFNVVYCITRIYQFIDFLQEKRNDFELFWDALENDENVPKKRLKLADIASKKETFEELFYKIMDTLIENCIDRFSDMKSLDFLSLLNVNNFKDYEKQFPEASFNCLCKFYGEFFDLCKLRSELQYLYSCPDYIGKSLPDIKNIIINDNLNEDILKELYNLISLSFTVPFASAPDDGDFSTLKRVQKLMKNAQSVEKLSSLALFSIEKELLNSLMESTTSDFYNKVINDFAAKNHHIALIYQK